MATKKKKLSPDVEVAMLGILEYAMRRPDAWHKVGFDPIHKQALEELKRQGVVEVWPETGLYRILS
jgi:hypothetical protein